MSKLPPVDIEYGLPPAVETLRSGWMSTLQSGAVVSSVLAGIEAQLLVFYTDPNNFGRPGVHSATQNAVKILTYVALVCSISATMSSLLLTDEFGEMPTRSARYRQGRAEGGIFAGTDWNLLRAYKIRAGSKIIVYHWLICLITACLCTIASTAVYAGTQEVLVVRIIVSIVAGVSALPLCWFVVPP
ncbi:unnamed protein product [Peniophora sp. CBMAI 1063]|nr:unnamed protein product [Peniophora sp. CBMAI 1063]